MLEALNSVDKNLLLFFNHLDNPVLDFLMYWASNKWIWIPLYAFLAFKIYKKFPQQFFLILVCVAVAIAVSDQLSSSIIKKAAMRLRPCHDPSISSDVHLVYGYCGGMYGFISSHASNAFTLFSFMFFLFRQEKSKMISVVLVWAIIVSYSRIYLGAHFPGDVLAGALLGFILGYLSYRLFQKLEQILLKKKS
jgi:undecaprenyl-diphosphatase